MMVTIRPWWLLSKVHPRRSKILLKTRFKPRALKTMPKLMRMLKEQRREGVEFNDLELVFSKDILARRRLRTICTME
jgi:hypothetical protein